MALVGCQSMKCFDVAVCSGLENLARDSSNV